MNKKRYTAIVLVFLTLFVSATIFAAKAAPEIVLTPTSSQPGHSVSVEGTDFAVSTSAGIGFGPEVAVTDESVTTTHPDVNTYTGFTANHPIKPGSFNWIANIGGVETEFFDNGDGTLGTSGFAMSSSVINYTSGFFSRSMQSAVEFQILWDRVDYTTYEFDVTPAGLATDNSGLLTGEFTVPAIWNETHTVTVIDETGKMATSDFTVFGSDVIPEALTIGAIVLLSSAALIVSFYCLRKRSKPERPA